MGVASARGRPMGSADAGEGDDDVGDAGRGQALERALTHAYGEGCIKCMTLCTCLDHTYAICKYS